MRLLVVVVFHLEGSGGHERSPLSPLGEPPSVCPCSCGGLGLWLPSVGSRGPGYSWGTSTPASRSSPHTGGDPEAFCPSQASPQTHARNLQAQRHVCTHEAIAIPETLSTAIIPLPPLNGSSVPQPRQPSSAVAGDEVTAPEFLHLPGEATVTVTLV